MDDDLFDYWEGDDDRWGDDEPPRRKRRLPPAGHWKTGKGEVIPFRQMEHSHLLNSIAWLERRYRSLQDTFNQDALDIDLLFPEHAGLVAEARRRKLIPRGKSQLVT